jgi:hypothetical protein
MTRRCSRPTTLFTKPFFLQLRCSVVCYRYRAVGITIAQQFGSVFPLGTPSGTEASTEDTHGLRLLKGGCYGWLWQASSRRG